MSAEEPSLRRILLTNDDGIDASGLKVLEEIAAALSDDIWVVAPDVEQSGAGHSLTLTRPLRMRKIGHQRYSVQGTPTDCVMLAINHLLRDDKPTLVLSGVNRGVNLGEDVTYSGTVAAAMEGTLAGVPSIAFSQARDMKVRRADFSPAAEHGVALIRKLVAAGWPEEVLINVNFPKGPVADLKGVRVTRQGKRDLGGLRVEEREDPRGFPYYWFGLGRSFGNPEDDTDLKAVRDGWISVTPLHLDLTHAETRQQLQGRLDGEF